MPTHAMRLHEWGTRGIGTISRMGHPPIDLLIFFFTDFGNIKYAN
jgi:hypothetical protein